MDAETKKALEDLAANVGRMADGNNVKAAAMTPVGADGQPIAVEKGLKSADFDGEYIDPVRKSFERLAKMSPSKFGHLGVKSVLDNPYAVLRAKNADGSFVMKQSELNNVITATLAMNTENGDAIAHGAQTIDQWAAKSGNPEAAIQGAFEQAIQTKGFGANSDIVRKAVDSSSGAALIRTDIEPLLREAFNRVFPAFDLFEKIPSNGIKHTWNQITAPGSATLLSELGDYSSTATNNTYAQVQSTNIAVAASQREIGLKAQWASMQSGMKFLNNGSVEIMGAMTAIANTIQGQIFQGNVTVGAKTLNDEEGLTNTLGFDGLRQQLMSGSYSINKSTDTYLTVLRRAVGQLYDAGADMSEVAIFMSVGANNALDAELETFYSYLKGEAGSVTPANFSATGLSMLNGVLARIKPIPAQGTQANGIGYYTYSAATTEDIYVVDPNGIKLPYIGSPGPTILELPTGWGNHLSNTFVPFIMVGMAIYVKLFNRKIRLAQTTI